MNKQNSIERDLDVLARLAAKLLAVPVVTISTYETDDGADSATQTVAHNAVACDSGWANRHTDIDITQLGTPQTAVAQHFEFYAAVPMRNGDGQVLGMVACVDDDARELSEEELETLKHISALAITALRR